MSKNTNEIVFTPDSEDEIRRALRERVLKTGFLESIGQRIARGRAVNDPGVLTV